MRIDCEQCGAAYAIDDSLISERGVRAQCPKCGAQKVVRRDPGANAAPPPSPFAPPGAAPFGAAPPPAPSPFGAAPPLAPSPFGAMPASSPFGGMGGFGGAPPMGGGDPFASPPPSPQAPSPFAPPPPPQAAPSPFAPAGDPFAAPPPGGDPFAQAPAPSAPPPPPQADPFANLGLGGPSSGGGGGGGGPSGGLDDDDPFANIDAGGGGAPDSEQESLWQVRVKGGELRTHVPLREVREMLRTGQLGATDEAAPMGGALQRVADNAVLAVSLPNAGAKGGRKAQGASAAGGGVPKVLAFVLVAVVVGGAGFLAYQALPSLFEARTEAGVNPFRRAKAQWSLQFPDVDGTSQEHVVEGRKHMRTDTAAGYRKADEHFRMALLLDVSNVNAIAGYVENFAHLPNVKADPDGVMLAFDGIEWALVKEPDNASLLRAKGALRLAIGNVDEAQKVLVQAQRLAPDDAMTKLLLARTHLERSVSDALALVKQVQAKDPELKQTLLVAGAAERRLGHFREARELLMQRLEADPANVAALKEMARLELDLGNGREAVRWLDKLLEAEQKDVDAHLTRAKITYQILGDLKGADKQLQFVIDEYDKVAGELLLPVLVHAAFVKAELGDLESATALAERARAQNGAYAPAHYVLGRIYLERNQLEPSQQSLETALGQVKVGEPLYEPLVRAQLADTYAAMKRNDAAIRELSQVIEYAPRSFRGYFALSALHMRASRPSSAFTVMRKALDIDPRQDVERPSLSDYPTSARDLVAYADAFAAAKAPEPDIPLKLATEGIVRYHAGQRERARSLFNRALQEDRYNHPALLYLSVMDFEDGRHAGVAKRLKQAERTTAGNHAVTQLYLARAELAGGDVDEAEKRLTRILDNEPGFAQAKFALGQVRRKQKRDDEALKLWRAIVGDAPDYLPVKRAIAELRAAK